MTSYHKIHYHKSFLTFKNKKKVIYIQFKHYLLKINEIKINEYLPWSISQLNLIKLLLVFKMINNNHDHSYFKKIKKLFKKKLYNLLYNKLIENLFNIYNKIKFIICIIIIIITFMIYYIIQINKLTNKITLFEITFHINTLLQSIIT